MGKAPLTLSNVFAGTTKVSDVKIQFPTNYEITVLTTKTKVKDILEEKTTHAGVPAKKISNNSSEFYIDKRVYSK